jgi:glycosyltransferase involved in cell wall biosynthesis
MNVRAARVVFSANISWRFHNYHRTTLAAFAKAGYEVHVVSPADDHAEKLKRLGYRHSPLPVRSASKNPFGDLWMLLRYLRIYRNIRPDLAFHFTIKCNLYGSLAAQALGIPHVSVIPGLGSAFDLRQPLRALIHFLYRATQRGTARVFFQNASDRRHLREHGIVSAAQSVLLPGSGVDLAHFQPDSDPQNAAFSFVFAGRLLWEKGFPELPEAMRIVRREFPEARCLVYGFADPESAQYVPHDRLKAWEAEGLLSYAGPVEDVRAAYRLADCVVLPTRYREGVPKSLLEAAAMAKPLIATDRPGCREAVENGVNGLLCPERNVEALARAMLEMIRMGKARRAEMGNRGRERMEKHFDERDIAAEYLRVAKILLEEKNAEA